MSDEVSDRSDSSSVLLVAAFSAIAVIAVTFLVRFALAQNVWIDESTQLSGITLSPVEMVRWLAGADQGRFGVPGDRMPPFSYFLDWIWSRIVSPAPVGLRLFHASIALAGVAVLCRTVGRTFGGRTALALAALITFSTRMVDAGVEVRAYPILIALTSLLLALCIHIVVVEKSVQTRSVAALTILGVLTVYTHFFGAMAYLGLAAGLLWNFRRNKRSALAILGASFLTLLSMVALKPIATAAGAISGAEQPPLNFSSFSIYAARLLGGSADAVRPEAAAAIFAGAIILLIASAGSLSGGGADSDVKVDARRRALVAALVALVVGVGATVTMSFAVHSFNALKSSYSLWTLPIISFVLAAAWSRHTSLPAWNQIGRHVALGLVLVGSGLAAVVMTSSPDLYIHGPSRFILSERAEAGNAPVIYDGEDWPWGYFPLRFFGRGQFSQWRIADTVGNDVVRIVDGSLQPAPQRFSDVMAHSSSIVLVVIRNDTYKDLRRYLGGSSTQIGMGPLGQKLAQDPEWVLDHVSEKPGYYSARIWVWRRASKIESNKTNSGPA